MHWPKGNRARQFYCRVLWRDLWAMALVWSRGFHKGNTEKKEVEKLYSWVLQHLPWKACRWATGLRYIGGRSKQNGQFLVTFLAFMRSQLRNSDYCFIRTLLYWDVCISAYRIRGRINFWLLFNDWIKLLTSKFNLFMRDEEMPWKLSAIKQYKKFQ